MGQSPDSKNYTDNPQDYILVQGNSDLKNGRVRPRVWTKQITKQAEKGSIILSVRAPVGDVGRTDFDVVLGRGVAAIQGNEFIYYLLSRMKINKYWDKYSTGSTFESINSKDINNAHIFKPQEEEQIIIGNFLNIFDSTITLHKRKLEQLQLLKKAYLQQLFPKKEGIAPRLRFANFNDNWVQYKLEELFSERTERSSKGELISVTINSGIIKASNNNKIDNSSSDKSNYKVVKKGDIAYNSMRMWQGASGHSKYNGILSPAYTVIVPHESVDSIFFSYMFKKYEIIKIFENNSQGLTSDTWTLKFPTFSKIVVKVPTHLEQQQIANYFEALDNLTILYQTKLEQLVDLKDAYLQNMFV